MAFTIVLVEPKIPPNTGNIARLCAATGCRLVLLGKLGFSIDDASVKRAGLDYWDAVEIHHEPNIDAYLDQVDAKQAMMLSTRADRCIWDVEFGPDDVLIFGNELNGLPEEQLARDIPKVRLPQRNEAVRSLNLANAVAVTVYEGMRQLDVRLDTTPDPDRIYGNGKKG